MKLSNTIKAWKSTVIGLVLIGLIVAGVHTEKLTEATLIAIVPIVLHGAFGDVFKENKKEID